MIGASLGVGVARGLASAGLPIAEIPLEVVDVLSSHGLTCELGGFALTNRGALKAHSRQRTDGDRLGDFVGAQSVAAGYRKGHLVSTRTGVSV